MNRAENAPSNNSRLQPATRGPNKSATRPQNANSGLPQNVMPIAARMKHATRNAMLKTAKGNWNSSVTASKAIKIDWTRKSRKPSRKLRTQQPQNRQPVKQNHSLNNASRMLANVSRMHEIKACHRSTRQTRLPSWHPDLKNRPETNWETSRMLCGNLVRVWPMKNS